jgi:ribosomal protein S12 methylthiotransferase
VSGTLSPDPSMPPLSIGLISLGCAKNLVDTQIMSGVILTEGLELAHSANSADIVLINTCAFIASAREEAYDIIEEMCRHKAAGKCRAIIVTGCLPQRYREKLVGRFPLVDAWLGVDELERIAEVATAVGDSSSSSSSEGSGGRVQSGSGDPPTLSRALSKAEGEAPGFGGQGSPHTGSPGSPGSPGHQPAQVLCPPFTAESASASTSQPLPTATAYCHSSSPSAPSVASPPVAPASPSAPSASSISTRHAVCPIEPLVLVSDSPSAVFEPRLPTLVFCNPSYAYLKIAEGCNHACAYCAIPGIRGRLRSRTKGSLVHEARALLEDGRRELNLIAQDVTAYGRDRRGGPRLASLIRGLDRLPGDFWLRLLYTYPAYLDDELLDTLRESRHVVPYLDVPIQHSHPDILHAMRRADTIPIMPGLAGRLRARWPGVALRTTCLVGFPGETETHFRHLLAYIKEARFDHLGVFTYSPEEGTAAVGLPGSVPEEVAQERMDRLMRAQRRISTGLNRARVGQETRVLLQQPAEDGASWMARAPWQAPEVDTETFVFGAPGDAQAGDFVTVRIMESGPYHLEAEASG